MAVAAARDCLQGADRRDVRALHLASTTLPFIDRQNAGILRAALNLGPEVRTVDLTGSQRAGTSGLLACLDGVSAAGDGTGLVVASDVRPGKPGSFQEMHFGDGAAALRIGRDGVLAAYRGSWCQSRDFNEHYRAEGQRFDYAWEDRWARVEGYSRLIPHAILGLVDSLQAKIQDIDRFLFPCPSPRERAAIARQLGVRPEAVQDPLQDVCGETGAAHPLLMLAAALEQAEPGQTIVIAGFGHGCEALLFETTGLVAEGSAPGPVRRSLERKKSLDSYEKYLVFKDHLRPDAGLRAEADQWTAQTVLWRNNDMLLGLQGGLCRECGTAQFPRQRICVNPDCGAQDSQAGHSFAERPARIMTFTGDMLSASLEPPHIYGMVEFEGGGRLMADLTDCSLDELQVGQPLAMTFRIKAVDEKRGFRQYFWKARPLTEAESAQRPIRFDGQVAVITGSGGGLGRTYALELAKRGACVVVNDLGGEADGSGSSSAPADAVVREIKELGGRAVASYDSVATPEGGRAIVRTAVDAFGRLDILINNAGILRDKTLAKMSFESWRAVLEVHLYGAVNVSGPALEVMHRQGYGRMVMTTSGAGLYGNFGQSNYGAAKMGLVGLMKSLSQPGLSSGIAVNAVAPLAASRLTQGILPEDVLQSMKPELVAPMVLYLCSSHCQETGQVFNCGLGGFSRAEWILGQGLDTAGFAGSPSPEDILQHWQAMDSLEPGQEYSEAGRALRNLPSS
jgi:3-hydroxy-3-methylglutaryl CoA synthase/NAD(P)-dependent dehydrogenase (short-subunit alcohol dehydrogenase family)